MFNIAFVMPGLQVQVGFDPLQFGQPDVQQTLRQNAVLMAQQQGAIERQNAMLQEQQGMIANVLGQLEQAHGRIAQLQAEKGGADAPLQ